MADKFKRTNKANIGDIVIDANHPAREFQVDGYSHEIYTDAEGEYEEITYDVYDVETCEFLIAFEEDLTVVVKAEMADDYLRIKYGINDNKPSDIERKIVDDIMREFTAKEKALREAKDMPDKPTANPQRPKEMTKQERIDRLLDEINFYKLLIELMGDEGRKFELAICGAKAKLKEMTGNGKS